MYHHLAEQLQLGSQIIELFFSEERHQKVSCLLLILESMYLYSKPYFYGQYLYLFVSVYYV